MSEKYITIKVRVEDHKKLKVKAAETGVSMMDMFSGCLADTWRSIDTAPKDGERILVASDYVKKAFIAFWVKKRRCWIAGGSLDKVDVPLKVWMPLPEVQRKEYQ